MILIAVLMAGILSGLQQSGSSTGREKTGVIATIAPEGVIKVTITTGGGLFGPVKNQFKVGEDIPVVISMTNNGDKPVQYCLSTSLLQNRPQLTKDGQLIPYATIMLRQADLEETIRRCESSKRKQVYELQPKQSRIVDFFNIYSRGILWYQELQPGHYELVLMRRTECCQGPMEESNKVIFEVVP
jgi:hypothetical protein